MKRKRLILLILLLLIIISIGYAVFYFFQDDITSLLFGPKDTRAPGGAIKTNQQVIECNPGDSVCVRRNEKIMINNLDGIAAKFASHQCSGPRACPTPEQAVSEQYKASLRSFLKEPNLKLLEVTGVTATGIIYYCSEDERCFKYNTKTRQAEILNETEEKTIPSSSPSAKPRQVNKS